MNLVAIDPAARRFAYAIFHDSVLEKCGYADTPAQLAALLDPERIYEWVLEIPVNRKDFAVAHNDLDRLRRTLAKIEKRAVRKGEKVVRVRPFAWKRNVPKRQHHKRTWAILSSVEKIRLPDRPGRIIYAHDVHDAVALGLTHLGRIKPGGKRRPTP